MTDVPLCDGLTTQQAQELQNRFGKNEITPQKRASFFRKVLNIVSEPMFVLLLVAAAIYFALGEARDGAIMLIFVLFIILCVFSQFIQLVHFSQSA